MSTIVNLNHEDAIEKLEELVEEIGSCLFCTNLSDHDGSTCRPMRAQKVCEQGNIWFFSEVGSVKNIEIEKDSRVQLFYSHPGNNRYMVVNGEAEIIIDSKKAGELWTSPAKIWFTEGKDDPKLSIIKVKPSTAFYWDADGGKMINFFKMVASIAIGSDYVSGEKGELNI